MKNTIRALSLVLAMLMLLVACDLDEPSAGGDGTQTPSESGEPSVSPSDLPSDAPSGTVSEPGEFPFEFSVADVYGETVTQQSLGSKELFFVHYWATWCEPCIEEMPELIELEKNYGDRVGFITLLDDYDLGMTAAAEIVEGAGFPTVDAHHHALSDLRRMVSSTQIPSTILLDTEGNLIGEKIIGAHGGEGYARFIEQALGN